LLRLTSLINKDVRPLSDLLLAPGREGAFLWKVIYVAAAGSLFCLALERRFALPLVPILDADSPNFLWPGLLKLNSGQFVHNAGLNFIYPGALFLLLRGFSDFRAIVIWQHLLGVAAGAFFLLSWNRLHDLDAASCLRRAVHQAIGLFGAGIYLLSPIPILFEMQIRPEAVCMFAQMLSFWLFFQFLFCRLSATSRRRAAFYGIAAVASALLLCSLKPSYALTALLMIGVLSWLVWRSTGGWRYQSLFLAGAMIAGLVIIVPEYLLGRADRLSKMFLPQTLFSVHAEIIREQMGDDLRSETPTAFPRPWLQTAYDELGAEIARAHVPAPEQFSLLGFSPDYLMNGADAIFTPWLQQLGSDDEFRRFLNYYYWRALQHRPVSFAAKISRQIGVFYSWKCPAFLAYRRIPLVAWHYTRSLAVLKDPENWEQLERIPAGRALRVQTEELCARENFFNSGKRLHFFHELLARTYLPLLCISAGLALWIVFVRKRSPDGRRPSLLVLFLFLTNFANVLAISAVHSMEVPRYATVQFAAALFAQLWAIRYLLEFALRGYQTLSMLEGKNARACENIRATAGSGTSEAK
jgi:hypothetical protein